MTNRRREIQPGTAAKMTGVALATSIPDLTAHIEMAVNSNTLLTSKVPSMAKAARALTNSISGNTASPQNIPDHKSSSTTKSPRRHRRRRSEKGQITVEFPVVFALATAAILICIQALGIGVTYMYATNAANEAARAYGTGKTPAQVQQVVARKLPDTYAQHLRITRSGSNKVTVTLPIPSVVNITTSADAGIVWEK